MAKQPAANSSTEARRLRAASLAFARQDPAPIDGYDTLSRAHNAKLLRAARSCARQAGCADCVTLLRAIRPLLHRVPTGDEVRAARAVAESISKRLGLAP